MGRHLLDGSLHNCLGEIIRTNVSRDNNRFPTPCLDLLYDGSSLLRIDTDVLQSQP